MVQIVDQKRDFEGRNEVMFPNPCSVDISRAAD